jgi:hypothetical protein
MAVTSHQRVERERRTANGERRNPEYRTARMTAIVITSANASREPETGHQSPACRG